MKLPKELTSVTPVSKITATIVLILVLLDGFALGILYQETVDLLLKKQAPNPIQAMPVAKPSPTLDETANWKTYMDKSGVLLFKLPQGYLTNPRDSESINIFNWSSIAANESDHLGQFWSPECINGERYSGYTLNCFRFGVYKFNNPPNKTLNELSHRDFYPTCKDSPHIDVPQCRGKADIDKEIIIGGKKAYFLQGRLGPAVTHIEVYIELNPQEFIHIGTDNIYNVAKIGQEADLMIAKIEQFDQILSTFRFIDQ